MDHIHLSNHALASLPPYPPTTVAVYIHVCVIKDYHFLKIFNIKNFAFNNITIIFSKQIANLKQIDIGSSQLNKIFEHKIVCFSISISLIKCFGAQKNHLIETVLLSTHIEHTFWL